MKIVFLFLKYSIKKVTRPNDPMKHLKAERIRSRLEIIFVTILIKKTFQLLTQYARTLVFIVIKKIYYSPFPALNAKQRSEPIATDIVYADTPIIDNESMHAQIFVGTKTL